MKKIILLGTLSMCLFACSNKPPKVKDVVRKMGKDELIEINHNGVIIFDDTVGALYTDMLGDPIMDIEVTESYEITEDVTYDGFIICENVTIIVCND